MSSLKTRRWKTASWTAALSLFAGSSLACLTAGCGNQTAADSSETKAESGTRFGEPQGVSPRWTPVAHAPGSPSPLSADRPPVIAPKPVPRKTAKSNHPPQDEMLHRLAARLHHEALVHFYSDPMNGFARLPYVYERIVRKWTTPYFSPGELGTDEKIADRNDLEKIHRSSLKDFSGKTPPIAKRTHRDYSTLWRKYFGKGKKPYDRKRKVWEVKSLDLIGLLKHRRPVAYVSEKLPAMDKLHAVPTRELDDFEYSGLGVLERGEDLYARSDKGVIRLLGAVRAKTDCLSCHTRHKTGDLLGVFSYTLREADYKRRTKRFGSRSILQRLRRPK